LNYKVQRVPKKIGGILMKKIIAITAMVAAAAGIAMAAEVSAGVRLTTNFFGVSHDDATDTNTISAFTTQRENQFYHAPISFSIEGEKAGAKFQLRDLEHSDSAVAWAETGKWNIWFKPIDMLKVNVGVWTNTLNQEHIGWYRSNSGIGIDDNANFALTLAPIDGLSIDAVVAANKSDKTGDGEADDNWGNAWFKKVGDGDAEVGQLGFMMHYGADFGTVSAMFKGENTFDALTFGVGYAGSVDPLSFFVNVLGFTNYKWDNDIHDYDHEKTAFDKVRVEAYAETTVDALAAKLWIPFEFKTNVDSEAKSRDKILLGALLRLDYTVGDYTLFLETGVDDFLPDTDTSTGDAKDFKLGIKPGVKFNVGECAIEAAVDISATKNFGFSVPVSFQVAF